MSQVTEEAFDIDYVYNIIITITCAVNTKSKLT